METKELDLSLSERETDITQQIKGYNFIKIEAVYGNLCFVVEHPTNSDIEKIKDGEIYSLQNITKIYKKVGGKSNATLKGILFKKFPTI